MNYTSFVIAILMSVMKMGLADAVAQWTIAGGFMHTCATDGISLYCWGSNSYGQLGSGKAVTERTPTKIPLPSNRKVRFLSAHDYNTCVVYENNSVSCWGNNKDGQAGLGRQEPKFGDISDTRVDKLSPILLGTTKQVTGISAGGSNICVLFEDGTLKCWGNNDYGQLGLGDMIDRGTKSSDMGNSLPFVDLGGEKAIDIMASGANTCAILDDRSLRCWGNYTAIGSGGSVNLGTQKSHMGKNLKPVSLGNGASVEAIASGGIHTCALLKGNRVKCWGFNYYGSLGLGDVLNTVIGDSPGEMGENLRPVNIDTLHVIQITARQWSTCALLENHAIKCWGYNAYGDLGLGDTKARGVSLDEMGENLPFVNLGRLARVESIAQSGHHTCVTLSNNRVKCWGWGFYGQTGAGDSANIGTTPESMGDNLKAIELPTLR